MMNLNNEHINPILSVCRLCVKFFTECPYPIKYLELPLNNFLPNLDFTLTDNPVVCKICVNSLVQASNFKNMYMESERRIQEYYDKTESTVNLYRFIESQQNFHTISNKPNNYFKHVSKIPIEHDNMTEVKEKQDAPEKPTNNVENISDVHVIHNGNNITKVRDIKIEKQVDNNNTVSENNTIEDKSSNIIIEILETDIESDDESNNSENKLSHESNKISQKIAIDDIGCNQLVDGDIDSDDSDMEFKEEFNYDMSRTINYENMDPYSIKQDLSTLKCNKSTENLIIDSTSTDIDHHVLESINTEPVKLVDSSTHHSAADDSPSDWLSAQLKRISSYTFMCMFCPKKFQFKIALDSHILSKHKYIPDIDSQVESKIHYCRYCDYRTINNLNLAKHIVSKHRKGKGKIFSCRTCSFKTVSREGYFNHLEKHKSVDLKIKLSHSNTKVGRTTCAPKLSRQPDRNKRSNILTRNFTSITNGH